MNPILQWIQLNPNADKAFLVSILALIAKGILAFTGKAANLGPWTDFTNQAIDLVVGGLTIYGVIIGTIHTSRGPALTQADHAASIVAAIQGPPTSRAVEEVKEATNTITKHA